MMFLKLVLSYVFLALMGYYLVYLLKISDNKFYQKQLSLVKTNFNALSALAIFSMLCHFLGLILSKLSLAFFISFALSLVFILVSIFILKVPMSFSVTKNSAENLFVIVFASLVSYSYFIKDAFFTGSWDCILHAYTACFVENDFYPPLHPNNINTVLDHYHYGTNLIEAFIQLITGAEIWDVMSLQSSLFFFFSFLAVFFIIQIFTDSFIVCFSLSFFILFFNSLNFWELLFLNQDKFNFLSFRMDLLSMASSVSLTSAKSIAIRISYYGWSIGFSFLFAIISLLLMSIEKFSKRHLFLFFSFSMMLYFTYPPMWYPLFVAFGLVYLSKNLVYFVKNKSIDFSFKDQFHSSYIFILISFFVAKYFSFTNSLTEDSGVHFLKLDPKLTTSMWNVMHPKLFETAEYVKATYNKFHPFENYNFFNPHLFSMPSFREFTFVAFLAIAFFVIDLFKNNLGHVRNLFFYAGMIGCAFPYIFEFVLRPIEGHRFIVIGKGFLLIYLALFVIEALKGFKFQKLIMPLFIIISMPGFLAIWYFGKPLPRQTTAPILSAQEKLLIKELKKIHKPGDIALDDVTHGSGPQISSFAGFYSTEGEYMKLPNVTRKLALKTLNPFLLKEMKVNYLVISNKFKFESSLINNSDLFTRVQGLNPALAWKVFRFNQSFDEAKYQELADQYIWALVYENKNDVQPIRGPQGLVTLKDRKELDELKIKFKDALLKNGEKYFIWTKARAVEKSAF